MQNLREEKRFKKVQTDYLQYLVEGYLEMEATVDHDLKSEWQNHFRNLWLKKCTAWNKVGKSRLSLNAFDETIKRIKDHDIHMKKERDFLEFYASGGYRKHPFRDFIYRGDKHKEKWKNHFLTKMYKP